MEKEVTLNSIPVAVELGGGYYPYKTEVEVTFDKEDNAVSLEFNDPDIDIKYCTDCYTANTLWFDIEDLRRVVEEWDNR